ncbi:hypothetical protein PCK2_000200, partial [Pneumocystis canis]
MFIFHIVNSEIFLFFILLQLRFFVALTSKTFFQPDEYWQSLEPAHQFVYGYGYLTWEWRKGIRDVAHPAAWVFSTYIKDIDQKPEPTLWGSRLPFNTVCGEFSSMTGGWVYDVKFSPSGNALAFTSFLIYDFFLIFLFILAHSSSVTIVYPSGNENPPITFTVNISQLPFVTLVWINEFEIIFAGYNCQLASFQGDIHGWLVFNSCLDYVDDSENYTFSTLKNSFRDMDLKGSAEDTFLSTTHQNTITLHSKKVSWWALFVVITSPFNIFFGCRTFSNTLESVFTICALYYWPLDDAKFQKKRLRFSLVLASIACVLRSTNIIIWVFLLGHLFLKGNFDAIFDAFIIGSFSFLLILLFDFYYYGKWTIPLIKFIKFNLVDGLSDYYGSSPWHYYFSQGLPILLFLYLPFGFHGAYLHKNTIYFRLVIVILFCYSVVRHKE